MWIRIGDMMSSLRLTLHLVEVRFSSGLLHHTDSCGNVSLDELCEVLRGKAGRKNG